MTRKKKDISDLPEPGDRKKVPDVGRFNVKARQCAKCLFGPRPYLDKVVADELIKKCLETDRQFGCHEYDDVCCKGFWNKHSKDIFPTRLALAFDRVEWIR